MLHNAARVVASEEIRAMRDASLVFFEVIANLLLSSDIRFCFGS